MQQGLDFPTSHCIMGFPVCFKRDKLGKRENKRCLYKSARDRFGGAAEKQQKHTCILTSTGILLCSGAVST